MWPNLTILLGTLLLLSACDSETGSRTAQGDCPSVGDLNVVEGNTSICRISGTLTVSATIPSGEKWHLNGALQVGDSTSSPKLTIEPGTQIRGSSGEYIYVVAGASISARGTKKTPIILSSNDNAEFNNAGGGQWGGLIIADSTASSPENQLEYLVVADAGEAVTISLLGTFQSNITLVGDHDDTSLRFVQSHDAEGDGIRLEGDSSGNQNITRIDWLLITGAGRDALSYNNFSGLVKDLLVIHRSGIYNDTNLIGGRAGIYASGANSLPLITNATLVGSDNASVNPAANDREMGIIFASDTTDIRLANILIANFRHGCYELETGANLSTVGLAGPTTGFINGLHCGNEYSSISGNTGVSWVVRSGIASDNFSNTGTGNGSGARFYDPTNIDFAGESANLTFTGDWFLQQMNTVTNGLALSVSALNAYNNGDTNNDSSTDNNDINALPLVGNTDVFFSSVNGLNSYSEGYDLTHIGAIRSSSSSALDDSSQFNGWALQDGATTEVVAGFDPVNL